MRTSSGYGVRANPEPGFPRYTPLDLGTVLETAGEECTIFGGAREVFETRYFDETPQPILQQLADNLVSRLLLALDGSGKLRNELHRQHLHPATISPELAGAFNSYSEK